MRIARGDESRPAKGWYTELDLASLPGIGFANQGIPERHYHRQIHEIYLVARGSSTIEIDGKPISLHVGDVLVVEPGEAHTFLGNSPDYFHFVLHCPPGQGDKVVLGELPGD